MIRLRPYQSECLARIDAELEEKRSTLVVMPTGTGKTTVFAGAIARRHEIPGTSTLVIAHREELIHQAAKRIERQAGLGVDIEMADSRAGFGWARAPVVCASIQTLSMNGCRRTRRLLAGERPIGFVVVDEAHHAVARSYRGVIDLLAGANDDCRFLGVTATPDRQDELALGQIFESVAYEMHVVDAIRQGWLVPIRQKFIRCSSLDLSKVHTLAGDLNQGELSDVVERERVVWEMVGPMLEITRDLRTLIFAVNVKHATLVRDNINARHPGTAAMVTGDTPGDERAAVFRRFGAGEIRYLVNVGIATEGWDDPATDGKGVQCIAMMRPTKSRSLYSQCIGRGTRPIPGVIDACETDDTRRSAIAASEKRSVLVLDFVGNSGRHQLVYAADVLGGRVGESARNAARPKESKGDQPEFDVLAAMDEAEARAKEKAERKRLEKVRMAAKAQYVERDVDPFRFTGLEPTRVPGWFKGKPVSDPQKNLLKKYGCPVPGDLNFHHAKQLLDKLTKQPTPGQKWKLKSLGIDWESSGLDFRGAMAAINEAQAVRLG